EQQAEVPEGQRLILAIEAQGMSSCTHRFSGACYPEKAMAVLVNRKSTTVRMMRQPRLPACGSGGDGPLFPSVTKG
ncbi:MAG TPA: hypothetical protein VGW38_07955, partial [Chloroflexota bacterium]|nr:hypothetical protein [Chloroflexota bacterium]